ncbi:MAG: response regulator [Treponema sp.]|jgi:signal transduction histidine kinase/CheY-like chemotaxis protein|nr:response regulator [Treponema sp.]
MPELRSFVKKVGATAAIYGQILLVFFAFTVMVISSYLYMERLMLARLEDEVNHALDFMQSSVESDLQEPEKLLQSISQSMRNMILNGYDADMIQNYIKEMIPNVIRYEKRKLGINRMYGYFDVFDGLQLNNGEWAPTGDNNPKESPWYKAAVEAKGKVTYTSPYFNARIRSYVLTYTRQIFNDGQPLAVLAIDVPIDKTIDYVTKMQLVEDGYGMLVDEDLGIIAHPDLYLIGKPLRSVNSGLAGHLANFLGNSDYDIPKSTAINYRGLESVVYSRKLRTGWYICLIAPVNQYYREIRYVGLVLTSLGMVLSVVLSAILWRISASKKRVDAENRQKSDFLAKMSHEIRTPMSAILGITEIQLQDRTLREDLREALGKIYNSGDLLLGIINDILDFSKIEAGKMELVPVKYYVASMINDVVQLNKIKNENKPIGFRLQVDELIPAELIGDELRIKQILNNLLSNSFKYTDKGEVVLSISVEQTRGISSNTTVVFKVSDTGQGMTSEQIHKVFDEYSRFNLEANRTTQGTGLGMSITRNLVYMMEGTISVKSAPGKGTEVTVKLPQRNEESGAMIGKEMAETLQQFKMSSVSQTEKAQITYDPMPYGNVLIVDDVETNLYVAKGLMAPYELAIDTAASGFETIDKVKNGGAYDIIFMDHMMPKMDGIETTKILREMGYMKPIIALTANALVGQAEMFMRNGFDGFISKPIDVRQLNTTLNKMIRDKQPFEVIDAARRERAAKQAAQKAPLPADSPLTIEAFVRDVKRAISTLELICNNEFRRANDVNIFGITVHSMKNALVSIDETELSNNALILEQAVQKKDFALIITETPAFIDSLRKVSAKLSEKTTGEPEDEDLPFLYEKLEVVRKACEARDKQTAKTVLIELKRKTWSRLTKDLLNTIIEHVLKDNFDEAAIVLRDYRSAQ